MSDFSLKSSSPDGLQPSCKPCVSAYDKEVYRRKRESRLEQVKANSEQKRDSLVAYSREWRKLNPTYDRENYATNPARSKRKAMRRYTAIKERTVPWSNIAVINLMVTTREWLCAETGTKWQIDHEIPLQGKLVSGLHVPLNLRIVPSEVNLQKQNRFEVV